MTDETTISEQEVNETSASIEDELGAIFDKANAEDSDGPARDEHGRFTARERAEESAAPEADATDTEDSTDHGAGEGDEAAPQALDPPASWSDAEKAVWPGLSLEAQNAILRREADWQKADSDRATRLKAYEPIQQALEPVRQTLALQGVDEAHYIRQLVTADQMLRQNPQQAIREIARMYGIDLQAQEPETEIDPALAPLLSEINQLKSQLGHLATSSQQAEMARAQAELAAFANDHPHFESVRERMGKLMQGGAAATLQEAYDMAIWGDPQIRAKLQAEQSAEAERKRKEDAEKKAAKARQIASGNLSSKGSSGGANPPQFKDREDELGTIYDQVQGAA